jgi:hypothetical protein
MIVDAQGDSAGLVVRAYRSALQSTPGVVLVAAGQPADVLIQIMCSVLTTQGGQKTGYAWAEVIINPATEVELSGPRLVVAGHTYRDIAEVATSSVVGTDRDVFTSLRQRENTSTQATPYLVPLHAGRQFRSISTG